MDADEHNLKTQIKELDSQIEELNRRIPPHGIKPSMIAELDQLEMQRDKLLRQLTTQRK